VTKKTFTDISSGYNLSAMNDNFSELSDELQNKVLYRDNPEGEPNTMQNDLDMGSNKLLNVADGENASDGVNLGQVQSLINGDSESGIGDTVDGDLVVNGEITMEDVLVLRSNVPGNSDYTITNGVQFGSGNPLISHVVSDDSQGTIFSWSTWDEFGNLRDMNLLPKGTLDIPGELQIDHQETKTWGTYNYDWTTTDSLPHMRLYPVGYEGTVPADVRVSISGTDSAGVEATLNIIGGELTTENISKVTLENDNAALPDFQINNTSVLGLHTTFLGTPGGQGAATISVATEDGAGNQYYTAFRSDGQLQLPSVTPTLGTVAVNKDYVDSKVTGFVAADGSVPLTADWDVGANKITNLTDPTAAQEAATKAYVDSAVGGGGGDITVDTDLFIKNNVDFASHGQMTITYTEIAGFPIMQQEAPSGVNSVGFSWIAHDSSGNDKTLQFNALGNLLLPESPTASAHATRKDYVDGLDAANVKITGAQTIAGVKEFTSGIDLTGAYVPLEWYETDTTDQNARVVVNGGNWSVARINDAGVYQHDVLKCDLDGVTTLFHNGTAKFVTSGAGGTVSGTLTVDTPTASTHAATKGYVDGRTNVAEGSFSTDGVTAITTHKEYGVATIVETTGTSNNYFTITLDSAITSVDDVLVGATASTNAVAMGTALRVPFNADVQMLTTTTLGIQVFNNNNTTFTDNLDIKFWVKEIQ